MKVFILIIIRFEAGIVEKRSMVICSHQIILLLSVGRESVLVSGGTFSLSEDKHDST
jgi:hypothetical protein